MSKNEKIKYKNFNLLFKEMKNHKLMEKGKNYSFEPFKLEVVCYLQL